MIKSENLTSTKTKGTSEYLILDHYKHNSKEIDILNGIDMLLSLPTSKEIQKATKAKILTYPKYQIKTNSKIFTFLGMKYYETEFNNGKKRCLLAFNNL